MVREFSNKPLSESALKRITYIYLCCLISGLIYSITQYQILGIVTTLFLCILPFLIDEIQFLYILFGLQFIRAVIPFEIGSAKYGFVLLVYMVLVIRTFIVKKRMPIYIVPALILFFIDIISSILNGSLYLGDTINWVGSLVILVYYLYKHYDEIDSETLFFYFCLAEWTICLVNIFAEVRVFGETLIPNMYGVWTTQLGAFAFGKAYASIAGGNGIAFNNALAIALCFFYILENPSRKNKLFYVLSIVFFTYTGILVISRGFYIELLIFIVLYALSKVSDPKKMLVTVIVGVLLFSVIYIYLHDKRILSFERVLVRFEVGNADRDFLIKTALGTITSSIWNALFGAGTFYPSVYDFTAHNIYLDSFVSLGIIGGSIYWGIILGLLKRFMINKVKFNIRQYIPLLMLFSFKYISGSTRDVGFYYLVLLCIVFSKTKVKGQTV